MIDFKRSNDGFNLLLGFDYVKKCPKVTIPVTKEEADQISAHFNEGLAISIGNNENEWSFGSFKLTNAPDHPLGWTDPRKRTLLHYNERSWHMIVPEIEEIGKLVQRVLDSNE
jgi:hypothetical protein